jgi:hypothetical protein
MRRLLVIGVLLLCGCGGKSDGAAVPLEKLPTGFLDTARKTLPNVKFESAWRLANGTYEIRGKDKNGKVREVEVGPDGAVVDVE